MKYTKPLQEATFIERPNRFLGVVNLNGAPTECFIPNPGRMHELMTPGKTVYLIHRPGPQRKTSYDMVTVLHEGTLVSIDSRLPNTLLAEAIQAGLLPEFKGFTVKRREPTYHDSRLDLELTDGASRVLVECKSSTLVIEGTAHFPDAPTRRGARHMNTLIHALGGGKAAACFIIQREDAESFTPHALMDPEFALSLRNASRAGVEVYAYRCRVTVEAVMLAERVPVHLFQPGAT